MNLKKLFETQKILRDRINYNEPDRFNKLILALLVEIGECANEWRGFKFWSKNQQPRKIHTTVGAQIENAEFVCCGDCGDRVYKNDSDFKKINDNEECSSCGSPSIDLYRSSYPLLEEYVDGLHFVLELGIEKGLNDFKYAVFICDCVNKQFIYLHRAATDLFAQDRLDYTLHHYRNLIQLYLGLGEMLGFTWEQIEQAYFEKNAVNHQRQEEGY
ncbi:dUTP diphosphatase [Cytobacillus sp.]|uniref:dUTP diphosphatase n=1 Tax=Cytobacillus sp. TaxID=2675269 RepID=UPI0028BF09E4|nr:dUTP diphosphatase [Cytobacillus sp.]